MVANGDLKEVFNPMVTQMHLMKARDQDISVDLRSDTVTRPTRAMRQAMCEVSSPALAYSPALSDIN